VCRGRIPKQGSRLVRWAAVESVQRLSRSTRPGAVRRPHQGSEKGDGMVATLVVVLPPTHSGGTLACPRSLLEHRCTCSSLGSHRPFGSTAGIVADQSVDAAKVRGKSGELFPRRRMNDVKIN